MIRTSIDATIRLTSARRGTLPPRLPQALLRLALRCHPRTYSRSRPEALPGRTRRAGV